MLAVCVAGKQRHVKRLREVEGFLYHMAVGSIELAVRDKGAKCTFVFALGRHESLCYGYRRPWCMFPGEAGGEWGSESGTDEADVVMVCGALFDLVTKTDDTRLRFTCTRVHMIPTVPLRMPLTLSEANVAKMSSCAERLCAECARHSQLCFYSADACVCVVGVWGAKASHVLALRASEAYGCKREKMKQCLA